MNILIVEDRAFQRYGLGEALKEAGFKNIELASSYKGALSAAKKNKPSIIIMDIMLGKTGVDYLGVKAALEIQRMNKKVHIIYLTGIPVNEELMKSIEKTKSFTLLSKVINYWQLVDKIKAVPIENSFIPFRNENSNLIFISYSHKDAKYMEEMHPYLEPLKKYGIDPWVDTRIEIGELWKDKIISSLDKAKAAILLISINFVNSDFINKIELPKLLKAAKEKGTIIIPIFLRDVPSNALKTLKLKRSDSSLLSFQGVNSPDKPLDGRSKIKRNKCWAKLSDFLYDNLKLEK